MDRKNISIAICDDELALCHMLEDLVVKLFPVDKFSINHQSFTDGISLIQYCYTERVDLIFLDIDMPSISGYEVAEKIRSMSSKCEIVFVTGHSHLVYQCFDFRPFQFIRKEILSEELKSTIDKYILYLEQRASIFTIKIKSQQYVNLVPEQIVYIESVGHNLDIHLKNETVTCRDKISSWDVKLQNKGFIRIHIGFMVNYKYVFEVNRKCVVLFSKQRLPISRSRYKEVTNQLMNLRFGEV